MNLNPEQIEQLKNWLASDISLSDIHKKVTAEWEGSMTYMELRFLIDDLDLHFPEEEKPLEENKDEAKEAEDSNLELLDGVSVEVDKIVRPDALVSGKVTFSDGQTAAWHLDQMGRISLAPSTEGYQPSSKDVQEFQKELQAAMQKAGF